MTGRCRMGNALVVGILMLATALPAGAATPKETVRYTSGPGALPGRSRALPDPVGTVAVTGFNTPDHKGWRAAKITLREESGEHGSISVILCYVSGCTGAGNIQRGFCTNSKGVIDLRKVGLAPGKGLSIRILTSNPGLPLANVPACDGVSVTGVMTVTYCKNLYRKSVC